jgi:hypothetical protein
MLSGCIKFHSSAGTPAQKAEVTAVATTIIDAMNRGDYGPVWDQSSELLKRHTPRTMYVNSFSDAEKILGQPGARAAPRVGFHKNVGPNVPEGDYSIVEFDVEYRSQFSIQKVALSRESGQWKLVGYEIQAKGRK